MGNAPTNNCFADSAVLLLGQKPFDKVVGDAGFEPAVSAFQMPRADQTTPISDINKNGTSTWLRPMNSGLTAQRDTSFTMEVSIKLVARMGIEPTRNGV